MVDYKKVGIFGAVAGLATPLILSKIVMPVLNMLGNWFSGATLKLANPASISINVRDSLTGIDGSFGKWLVDATGMSANLGSYSAYIMGALGGALLFIIGAWVADMVGILSKGTPASKVAKVIFMGSAAAWLIFGTGITGIFGWNIQKVIGLFGFDTINVLLAFAINAGVLAGIYYIIEALVPGKQSPF